MPARQSQSAMVRGEVEFRRYLRWMAIKGFVLGFAMAGLGVGLLSNFVDWRRFLQSVWSAVSW